MRQDFKLTVAQKTLKYWVLYAGIAQLVERNLAKVEVASSSLVSRSRSAKREAKSFPFSSKPSIFNGTILVSKYQGKQVNRRDSKAVMQRIANPSSPVRLWIAPPKFFIGIKKIAPSGAIFVCG